LDGEKVIAMSKISTDPHDNSSDAQVEAIKNVVKFLKDHGRVLTTAESCTAGEVCSLIADVSGSGCVLYSGYVVYSEQAKQECLGVSPQTIQQFGLTSEEVAREMVLGALNNHKPAANDSSEKPKPNLAVAITGAAESDDEQDGVVCFAYAARDGDDIAVFSESVKFQAHRNEVRSRAAHHAILYLPTFCQRFTKS